MANTKTKTLSKTLICRILKENCNDFWKNIFVVGDESDNIISILCPLRDGYKPGIIDVTTILEA